MTRKNHSELVLIVDRSGSMGGQETEVISSINDLIKREKESRRYTCLTLVLFDSTGIDFIYEYKDISQIETFKDYVVGECTPLNDAIGTTIDRVGKRLANMEEDKRPELVFVAIITDGMENASKEYTLDDVKKKVKHQEDVYRWKFDFISKGLDVQTTQRMATAYHITSYNCSQNMSGAFITGYAAYLSSVEDLSKSE